MEDRAGLPQTSRRVSMQTVAVGERSGGVVADRFAGVEGLGDVG